MKKLFAAAASLLLLFAAPLFADDQTAAPAAGTTEAAPAAGTIPSVAATPMGKKVTGSDAEIRTTLDEISADWASGDAHKMASHWLEKGSLITPFGKEAWNRAEVEEAIAGDLEMMKGSTQTFSDPKIDWILGGCALVDTTGTIGGMKNADGTDAPSKEFHVYMVLVQRGSKWMARAVRPYAFLPAPDGSAAAPAAASTTPSDSTVPPAPDSDSKKDDSTK